MQPEGDGLTATCADRVRDLGQFRFVYVGQGDLCPFSRQPQGAGLADAGGRAGYEGGFAEHAPKCGHPLVSWANHDFDFFAAGSSDLVTWRRNMTSYSINSLAAVGLAALQLNDHLVCQPIAACRSESDERDDGG